MTCGIYHLNFGDRLHYIGKSINIEKRFEQHFSKLRNGKHTPAMNDAYRRHGNPHSDIVVVCHPDHIDLLETIVIEANADTYALLNAACTTRVSIEDTNTLIDNKEMIQKSTGQHIRMIGHLNDRVETLETANSSLKSQIADYGRKGIVLPKDQLQEMIKLRETLKILELDNSRLKRRADMTWWQRLWS